jgi:hypothetical protein
VQTDGRQLKVDDEIPIGCHGIQLGVNLWPGIVKSCEWQGRICDSVQPSHVRGDSDGLANQQSSLLCPCNDTWCHSYSAMESTKYSLALHSGWQSALTLAPI